MKIHPKYFLLILSLVLLTSFSFNEKREAEAFLHKIPVQSGGRVKPFQSFAREVLLSVVGKSSLEGKNATFLVWEWIARPDHWYNKSFIPVKYPPLREEFPLMIIGGKISPEIVLSHGPFQAKVKEAMMKEEKKEPISGLERRRIQLYDQARLFQAIAQGELPGFIPHPIDPKAGWVPLVGLANPEERVLIEAHYSPQRLEEFQMALNAWLEVLREGNKVSESARRLALSIHALMEAKGIVVDQPKIAAEILYLQIHPFKWAWVFYLGSGLLWFIFRNRFSVLASGLFLSGFILHTLGFAIRSYVAGRPPVTNMYESVIWVAWAVVFFSIILRIVYKVRKRNILSEVAAWVAFFALLVGESFPTVLDPSLSPLVPVLRNNYWLTVHVLTITLSYGAFALAWGLGHVQLVNFAFNPNNKWEEKERLAVYLYRTLQIGVILLTAGTILGGIWANDSWGRFWGWDPKETWALIALLGYLVVLHGRFFGWLGFFGTALGSILAFLGILMTWYGVNFVLAAGFHSYGFSAGGLPYVLIAILADLLFISFLVFRYNKGRSALSPMRF